MRIALYQPEIAGNVGAILRLAACMAVPVEIIEPCGFVFDDKRLKRAAMDYGPLAEMTRHADWPSFQAFARASGARGRPPARRCARSRRPAAPPVRRK